MNQPSFFGALTMLCVIVGVAVADTVVLFPPWLPFALAGCFGVAALITG
jgi:hypothetical protein